LEDGLIVTGCQSQGFFGEERFFASSGLAFSLSHDDDSTTLRSAASKADGSVFPRRSERDKIPRAAFADRK
jgi:hypothetical protein